MKFESRMTKFESNLKFEKARTRKRAWPVLISSFFRFSEFVIRISLSLLLQPFAQSGQTFMRPWDYLDANHLPDLRGRGRAGISGGFHRGDVAAEKSRHVTAADFLPANEGYVGGFQGRIARFQ
jgi:hypothetical protein